MTLRQAVVPLLVLVCLFGIGKEIVSQTTYPPPSMASKLYSGNPERDAKYFKDSALCQEARAALKGAEQLDSRCRGFVPNFDANTVDVMVWTKWSHDIMERDLYAVTFRYDPATGQFTRGQTKLELAADPEPAQPRRRK